jgi:Do/DeqQ family serine protease
MLKRLSFSVVLLAIGIVTGLVVSGRGIERRAVDAVDKVVDAVDKVVALDTAEPSIAPAPDAAQPASSPTAAGPDFTRVAEQTVRAVTNISAIQIRPRANSPFASDPFFQYFLGGDPGEMFGYGNRYESSLGSGVLITADGYVITNNHVIGQNNAGVTVAIGDRRELAAKIVGTDSWTDLALLKIDATGLPVIPWGDSSRLKVAEWVMAVGNPFSLNQTVTLGIVSALGRAGVGISTYEDFIQTDAAINPGNSGGALINLRGELVGINTAIFSQSGGYQGIGFAVPSNLVRRVVDDLREYGEVRRGSIGIVDVSPVTNRLAQELRAPDTNGVVVMRMFRESSAYQAGLRPGDIITRINDTDVTDPSRFVRVIADSEIGSKAQIEYRREGKSASIRVTVEQQQRRPQAGR